MNERTAVLKRFIDIAQQCIKYNNYNTLVEVLCTKKRFLNTGLTLTGGLRLTPVSRLKQTWRMLPPEYIAIYDELVDLSSSDNHHKNLVAAIKKAPLPTLPYLGMYLTWLTFIEGKKTDRENDLTF